MCNVVAGGTPALATEPTRVIRKQGVLTSHPPLTLTIKVSVCVHGITGPTYPATHSHRLPLLTHHASPTRFVSPLQENPPTALGQTPTTIPAWVKATEAFG